MNNTYLSKKIIFIHNKCIELQMKVNTFHTENPQMNRELNPVQFNYILSFLTMIDYLQDKINSLLKKILVFNRSSDYPITKKQVYLLVDTRKRLKNLKEREKNFLE